MTRKASPKNCHLNRYLMNVWVQPSREKARVLGGGLKAKGPAFLQVHGFLNQSCFPLRLPGATVCPEEGVN